VYGSDVGTQLIRKKRQDNKQKKKEKSLEITDQNDSRQDESPKRHISGVGIRKVRVHMYQLCNDWTSIISTHVSDLFHSKESFGRRRGD
jgi:hypothetical protein